MLSVNRAAFFVTKGGVGKTTSTAHVAVVAAQQHDQDVLIIDLAGTQNDIASQFGLQEEIEDIDAPISAVFGDRWDFIQQEVDDVIGRLTFDTGEGPDLIPADPDLGGADNQLANVPREERYDRLDAFVTDHVAPEYDLVLMDLPGAENNIAINGLFAAGDVVVPLKPGEFELQQLQQLEADLDDIRESYPVDLHLSMVIPTMIEGNTNMGAAFVDQIQEVYGDRAGPAIADTENIPQMQKEGQTLFAVADYQLYDTGVRARDGYRDATERLLEVIGDE